ncbi:PKD domain-containing protein [Dongshaea marina]|uniref:PKD domain-containing protein n=1 Tax=Dongshaea marina TaxID=2047966 RepID=UPI000D3E8A61|nr:glycosyl hydrolase family 18 protein [Dongshaea marina]
MKYQGQNYMSLQQVQGVLPGDNNPWKMYIAWGNVSEQVGQPKNPWPTHVFSPYVDFTANAMPDFADLAKNHGVTHVTTAFLVAGKAGSCMPSWGGYHNVNDYPDGYKQIKAIRDAGGDVMVSFGGASGLPLATECTDVSTLADDYVQVVKNLNLNAIDFDIEGQAVALPSSYDRRNQALAQAQQVWKSENKEVKIWFTLPVLPTGLTADGLNVLKSAKKYGVDLTGINVMTMDYGGNACPASTGEQGNVQGQCSVDAINALFTQVKDIFGQGKSDEQIWAMLGTTPMIGVNDVNEEVFYPSDAQLVMDQAQQKELGMIGMWSVNRDQPGEIGNASPYASGLTAEQAPAGAFAKIFADHTDTGPMANAGQDQWLIGPATVTLDGSASSDSTGTITSYNWSQPQGQSVQLTGADTAHPSFQVGQENHSYTFTLTVKDDQGESAMDNVQVTVSDHMVPPTVTIAQVDPVKATEPVSVSAQAVDPTHGQLSYQWTVPSGFVVTGGQNSSSLQMTAPNIDKETVYDVSVNVTSTSGESAKASTQIDVKPQPSCDPYDPAADPSKHPEVVVWNSSSVYKVPNTKVSYHNLFWINKWEASPGQEPGNNDVWQLVSNVIMPWNAASSYSTGTLVSYKGHKWEASYWANAYDEPGVALMWVDQGPLTCSN